MRRVLLQVRKQIEKYKTWRGSLPYHQKVLVKFENALLNPQKSPVINKNIKVKQSVLHKLPKMNYEDYTSFMIQFFNSMAQNGRVNGQQLVFITGAKDVGKSWFIQQMLHIFKRRKISPKKQIPFSLLHSPQSYENNLKQYHFANQNSLIVQFDMSKNPLMTQEAFFDRISRQIISQILFLDNKISQQYKLPLLSSKKILQINFHENTPQYYLNELKQTLQLILNDCSPILQLNQSKNQQVKENKSQFTINNKHLTQETKDTRVILEQLCNQLEQIVYIVQKQKVSSPKQSLQKQYLIKQPNQNKKLYDIYQKIVEVIASNNNISALEAALKLGLAVASKIQWQQRQQQFEDMWYETGIQKTQFLFDILNYICGFGAVNRKAVSDHFKGKDRTISSETYIDKGNHVDVVMVFQHLEKMNCYGSEKFMKWHDYLLTKIYNYSNLRTHFPVVIELQNSHTLYQIRRFGKLQPDNPVVLQLPGYFFTTSHKDNISALFQKKKLTRLFPKLGRSPKVWRQSIDQMNSGVQVEQLLLGKSPLTLSKQIIFQSKLNKIALFPESLPFIDNGTLRFKILHHMNLFRKTDGLLSNRRQSYNWNLYQRPEFAPMYKLNILYRHFYQVTVDITDSRYIFAINKIQSNYHKKMGIIQRLKYYKWKWSRRAGFLEGVNYGFLYKQIRHRQSWEKQLFKYNKFPLYRPDYHLDTYFSTTNNYKVRHYEEFIKSKYNI